MTFTLIPSPMTAVIAGNPARVAGILIRTLLRSTILNSSLACSMVAVGVLRQSRVDLDRHPAVDAVAAVVDPGEEIGCGPDVVGGQFADGRFDRRPRSARAAMCGS